MLVTFKWSQSLLDFTFEFLNCSNFGAKYCPGFQFNPELDSRAESCKKKSWNGKCMSECMRRHYYALFDSHPQHDCSISSCTK